MNAAPRRHALGLSLIELMIALLIGSILMLGVIQVFSASRNAYQLSQGMARVQENGRFAMDYLQRDVRMVGHYGCVNDQARLQTPGLLTSYVTGGDNPLNFAISLQGYEANGSGPADTVNLATPTAGWQPGLPAYLSGLNPKPGSDIIVMRFFYGSGAPVTVVGPAQLTVLAANWGALTGDGVGSPALFGVGDCSYADVFQASATDSGAGTVTTTNSDGVRTGIPDFVGHYTATPSGQATLYRAESMVYYVATRQGAPVSSLYRTRFGTDVNGAAVKTTTEELVEGIDSIQLIYGQDQSVDVSSLTGNVGVLATANTLGPAVANENAWRRVEQVRIGVIASSAEVANSAQRTQGSLTALGTSFTAPNDGRYRSSYESVVALRNRLYGN
ncbi:PilW family protein [Pseudoxanthomonas winnipegensis]|nr:PilW family protein [Pseudoxanthomonas winnipegensis]